MLVIPTLTYQDKKILSLKPAWFTEEDPVVVPPPKKKKKKKKTYKIKKKKSYRELQSVSFCFYRRLKRDAELIQAGHMDSRLDELCNDIAM